MPVVLILASGRGERYRASGGTTHKLQADLNGQTVLQRTLDAVRASGLRWHLEDAGHPGMGDSIAAAVRATADAQGWLILPADLPLVMPATLLAIATAPLQSAVLVPQCNGQRGHPVRFSRGCRDDLMRLAGATGAASVVATHGAARWPTQDWGCITDIDTVDDLQRARERLNRRTASQAG